MNIILIAGMILIIRGGVLFRDLAETPVSKRLLPPRKNTRPEENLRKFNNIGLIMQRNRFY